MILRFGVANHRSIRDQEELSLVASSLDDVEEGLLPSPVADGQKLLPAVVIYGANAAGKSSLVSALLWMRSAILHSHSRGEPGERISRSHFLLDRESAEKPTAFNIDFVLDGVRYHYGFEASINAFEAEWLYCYPNDRRQALFERSGLEFTFGRSLKGKNKAISSFTRPNSLFLSAAAQNGHELLSNVLDFFRSIQIEQSSSVAEGLGFLLEGKVDPRVITFLTLIGTGVVGYNTEEIPRDEKASEMISEMDSLLVKHLGDKIKTEVENVRKLTKKRVQLAHNARDSEAVYMDLSLESDGTRRLLSLLTHVFAALDQGSVLVCDELDASLHTLACEAVLDLFSDARKNLKGAQLIATTHDTNLLLSKVLRRDQVWFAEKDSDGATHYYPLTDIRTRKGDNLERGYLQGRYGAIPLSGDVSNLITAI